MVVTVLATVPLLGPFISPCLAELANAEGGKVKIVSSLPRTGSANAQTTSMVQGIRMALAEVNNRVGEIGIEYEDWDDASPERGQWDPAVEAANANRAANDPHIVAYIGTYNSGAAKIAMPILNQAGLAMVSPANTWPGLTKPGLGEANEPQVYRPSGRVTYFRVVPADDLQGLVAARWTKELGAARVFILHDRELYGKGVAGIFEKTARALGIEILGVEGIDTKASNYRALMVKIRQLQPDLVYFGGTTQSNAGQLAKDMRAVGIKAKYMLPDGCFEQALIQAAGAENLNELTYLTFAGLPPSKLTGRGREFYENFKRIYGTEPEAYAAYSYESARIVLEAIRRAKSVSRSEILSEIARTKNFESVLGTFSLDENGDSSLRTMSGNTIKGGKFEFVKLLN